MIRLPRTTLLAFALLACGRITPPETVPEPAIAPDSTKMLVDSVMASGNDSVPTDTARVSENAVSEEVASLFANDSAVSEAAAEGDEADAEVTWDIDVNSYVTHNRVAYYVDRFTSDARDRVVAWMQRGLRYEPMIRSTFRQAGIPEDMYYLAFVESGYDPHAYSRAAAVGMWQFMATTAKGVGLRVDWWIDERRDPVRSTRAAARFLGSLRDQFGSLYLAAAAYNGGPGRVARSLSQHAKAVREAEGDDRFFVLADRRALRAETSNYVPQLIAAALIGKDPRKYGIELTQPDSFAYDSVRVPAATSISAVANATGATLEELRDLNPHVLRGVTPLSEEYWVRVPLGSALAFDSGFASLSDSVRTPFKRIKAKKGATVSGTAKSAGITAAQLRWYNPKLRGNGIPAGSVVLVPSRDVVRAAFDVPDPSVERYGASASGVHVVRRGETLSHLAVRYDTSVTALMRLNRLRRTTIYAGQSIRVR